MQPMFEPGVPELDAWEAWHPRQAAEILAECAVAWFVAGGWAIDLWAGRQTREHEDLEIAIPRSEFATYRAYLTGLGRFDLYDAGSGRVRHLADGQQPNPENHQIWLCERDARAWRMDTFLEPGDTRTWVSHRDPRIRVPMDEAVRVTDGGIRYLAPEIVLFTKAKHAREKDEADLTLALPMLDPAERRWLVDAIDVAHPGHRWLDSVDATGRRPAS